MRCEIRQIKEILLNVLNVYGVSDDKQSLIEFSNRIDSVIRKNTEFQNQTRRAIGDSSEIKASELLLDGKQYQKLIARTKQIEKRASFIGCNEFCFKEFSYSYSYGQSLIEIIKQVNILKELQDFDHIVKFFGVAHEDSRYYLVTEWMEYGNLHEYYTKYGETIDWNIKIEFALDICRGVVYLHECKVR